MIRRRLAYLAALVAAILFYLLHRGHFSYILLWFIGGLLPMELLLTLPVWRATRVSVRASRAETEAGKPFLLTVRLKGRWPVCNVQAVLLRENRLTGETSKEKIRLRPGKADFYEAEYTEAACGAVTLTLRKVRMLDVAGVFRLPLKAPPAVLVLVRPAAPAAPLPLPPAALDQSALSQHTPGRPAPGAMREFADVREYRPGDALRDVHWKLTAKTDKLMVRESTLFSGASPHLCFDFCGNAAALSLVLGRVESLSRALWEIERLHEIHWYDENGLLQTRQVGNRADFDTFLWGLLSGRLPAGQGVRISAALPTVLGPILLVDETTLRLYDEGALKEVLE